MSALLARNEGAADRTIRVLLGIALLSLYLFGPETRWALLGLAPLLTGLIGTCPLYSLLGIHTCPVTGG
jgi:hypothetical protein